MDVVRGTPGAGGHRPPSLMPARNPSRLLAVVGDAASRNALERMLHRRGYVVTACSHPAAAIAVLGERRGEFDAVLIDMLAPRDAMLELFERVENETGLLVYVMSMSGHNNGFVRAYRPMTTPAGMADLETFLQSMMDRMSQESRPPVASQDGESNGLTAASAITTVSSSRRRATRRRNQERETTNQEAEQNSVETTAKQNSVETTNQEAEQNSVETTNQEAEQNGKDGEEQPQQLPRKQRLVWNNKLHSKFVYAHDRLLASGEDVPKRILELMNVSALTRANVASHLQKYRKQRGSHVNRRANSRTRFTRDPLPQAHTMHERAVPPQEDSTTLNMSQQHRHNSQPVQRSSNHHNKNPANLCANQSGQTSSNPLCDNSANLLSQYASNLHVQPRSTITHPHHSAEVAMAYKNIIMAPHQLAAAASVHIPMGNYSLNAQTMIGAPTASGMQNHRLELHVSKEHTVSNGHVGDGAKARCTVQKEMHGAGGAQVGHESVAELVPNSRHSDGSYHEDLNKTFQQLLNNDSEPSWDYEFLHRSD